MAFSTAVRDSAVAEINITPLIDVMLVLLVIFMVSAPMIARPLDASLPQESKFVASIKPPMLRLEISDDGAYRLDGRVLKQQQLGERLRDSVATDPRTVLTVHASSNTHYQRVVTALSAARDEGVVNIGMQP